MIIIKIKSQGKLPPPSPVSQVLYVCDSDWVNVMICVSASQEGQETTPMAYTNTQIHKYTDTQMHK